MEVVVPHQVGGLPLSFKDIHPTHSALNARLQLDYLKYTQLSIYKYSIYDDSARRITRPENSIVIILDERAPLDTMCQVPGSQHKTNQYYSGNYRLLHFFWKFPMNTAICTRIRNVYSYSVPQCKKYIILGTFQNSENNKTF